MAAVSCPAPALAPRLDVATARAIRARIASPFHSSLFPWILIS